MRLTQQEINARMIELRNLRKLHGMARARIVTLETENKVLRERVATLEAEQVIMATKLTDVSYQLEELKMLIFKKHRRVETITDDTDNDTDTPPPAPRTSTSYHRPTPEDTEITKTEYHRFNAQHTDTRTRVYFVEDIPLTISKQVTKHVVEQYYDRARRVWVSCAPLPSSTVILGDNVRILIATLSVVERLSFSQIQTFFRITYGMSVSDGEIACILRKEAHLLTPACDVLLAQIQSEPSHHMDESRYDVRGESRYVWSITGGVSGRSVYRVGVSRGKGIAVELRGESLGILLSDDYGVYRTLAAHHQLCFAHLIRKFRDLGESGTFTGTLHEHLSRTYRAVQKAYRAVVHACNDPDPERYRASLVAQFSTLATVSDFDPVPIVRLKTTLRKNIPYYLTCLKFPTIALTNNAAERALRHVVLKRKNSFGCKSDRGAAALGVLLSVLLDLYRRDPGTYFSQYARLRRV